MDNHRCHQEFSRGGGGTARKFACKLTFKMFKAMFTDHPEVFSIHEYFLQVCKNRGRFHAVTSQLYWTLSTARCMGD